MAMLTVDLLGDIHISIRTVPIKLQIKIQSRYQEEVSHIITIKLPLNIQFRIQKEMYHIVTIKPLANIQIQGPVVDLVN